MTCVNLRERFGDTYRITYDPAVVTRGERNDSWMMQLAGAGEGVTIYPHGGTRLAVEVDHRPKLAKQVAAIPGVVLHQDGSGEKTYLFDIELFEQVAALVKPRRRRRCHLTEEQIKALGDRGKEILRQRREEEATGPENPTA